MAGISEFIESMSAHSLPCLGILPDGKIHRFQVDGDKSGSKNGWYVFYGDNGLPAGAYGSWKTGKTFTWCGKSEKSLSDAERAEWRKRIAEAKTARNEEQKRLQSKAREKATKIWENSKPIKGHPYLTAKSVKSYGLRQHKESLVIPLRDTDDNVRSLQFIDGKGDKRFLSDGAIGGHFYTIHGEGDTLLVCEGYATGASLHEATGYPIACALNCRNLKPVCEALRKRLSNVKLVVCGDDDFKTDNNPGLTAARKAAQAVGGSLAVPKFNDQSNRGTDFNDLHQIEGLEVVQKQIQEALKTQAGQSEPISADWEDPVLLEAFSLPEMKPIPGIIGKISQAISTATETPIELSQGLILATAATACQGRFIVQVKSGYSEPVNVWVVIALDSGNRKSSVLIEVTRPLMAWESRKRFEMEEEIKKATSRRANQEIRLKSLRAKYGKAKMSDLEKIEKEIQDLEKEFVEVPISPRVWCDDVTTEHLGTLMSAHKERMSILSAEGGIIDTISGRYSNGILNMDLYLKGHSGDPVRVDRGSREPIYMRYPSLTMGLSPQPDVLKNMANIPGFRGRGFIARAGYLLPQSRLGYRSLETMPVSEKIRNEYERVIHSLLDIEPGKNDHGESVPYILDLSKGAYQEWMDFSKVVEVKLREGGKFEHITDWAGKLPGFAIRLSGLLHCLEDPHQPWTRKIGLETMSQALELASIFSHHALAVFDLMGADKALQGSRKIWRWVERGRFAEFSKRDCYNSLKGSFPRVQDIEPCLDVLEERGYIAAVKQHTGGRPTVLYTVNPKLTGAWS